MCPLETLSLTHCQLSHTDWNRMPHLEITRHLKHLDLSYIKLTDFSPEPLKILLENVAATLSILHLENCGITDAQFHALFSALSCCSRLTAFCFIRNFISIDTMKSLLCHTTRMSNLRLELHSVPQEVYIPSHGVNQQIQNQVQETIRSIIKPLNHPRTVWFCNFHCECCCTWPLHNIHLSPCPACVPV